MHKDTIGIIKVKDNIELVISEDNFTFTTIKIGFFDITETIRSKSEYQFQNFPLTQDSRYYSNMYAFMKDNNRFHNWFYQTFKNNE